MSYPALNGWTSARLDDLARDVADIRMDINEMRSEKLKKLEDELLEAKTRPRRVLNAYLTALCAGMIPTLVILLTHYV